MRTPHSAIGRSERALGSGTEPAGQWASAVFAGSAFFATFLARSEVLLWGSLAAVPALPLELQLVSLVGLSPEWGKVPSGD